MGPVAEVGTVGDEGWAQGPAKTRPADSPKSLRAILPTRELPGYRLETDKNRAPALRGAGHRSLQGRLQFGLTRARRNHDIACG